MEYGIFSYLVEHYPFRVLWLQTQHFVQVPGDSLPFAVFIGCQPHSLGIGGLFLQIRHQFLLVRRHNIVWRETVVNVNAEVLLLKVADVTVAGHDLEVLAQEFLNRLCLGRRLNYHEILLHGCIKMVCFSDNSPPCGISSGQMYAKKLINAKSDGKVHPRPDVSTAPRPLSNHPAQASPATDAPSHPSTKSI